MQPEGLVGGEAGKFLILDLDTHYMDVLRLWKMHEAVAYDNYTYICIVPFK